MASGPSVHRIVRRSARAGGQPFAPAASPPGNPLYGFRPFSHGGDEPPPVRIPVEGPAFAVPAAPVALATGGGFAPAGKIDRAPGLDRDTRTARTGAGGRTANRRTRPAQASGECPRSAGARHRRFTPADRFAPVPRIRVRPGGRGARAPGERPVEEREAGSLGIGRRTGDPTMFAFDTDHDAITPAGGALLAELGLNAAAVRDALADDRARRCPDREAPADPG